MISVSLNLWAQAPEMFRYQGRLVDGTNLVNATVPMSFKLYDALSGGTRLYEDSNSVLVVDGLYSTYIGDNTVYGSLTNAVTNAAVYLELTVNGATLSPRERLVSVPYALNVLPSTSATVNGDPTAASNEVVNTRWTKNFYANGDITMSDRDTGLMWLYNANPCGATNWYAASTYCGSLTYAGYSDWRLPSRIELASQLYVSEYFINMQYAEYWSGTSAVDDANRAWTANMGSGGIAPNGYKADNIFPVWPVRGGKDYSPDHIISLSGDFNFGSIYIEGVRTAELWIYNKGNDVLTVTGIQYSEAHFSGNWAGALPPGGSTNITVTFAPVLAQAYSGTITVNCDKTSGTNTIACTGDLIAARYIDNGDGTVSDPSTGLMWTKNANHGRMTWNDAVAYCANLVTNGYSDWRLPSVARDGGKVELDTLFRANGNPDGSWEGYSGTPFTGVNDNVFWSGTSYASNSSYKWVVAMVNGGEGPMSISSSYLYVWPVRGGQ